MRRVGRRLGKGYDLCMCYTTPSTESPTVASQRLQGPVLSASPYTLRLCAIPIAVSQLGVGSPSGHNARACICQTRADAMACLGCAGVGVGVPSQWLFGHLAGSDPFEARSALQKRKGTQLVPSLKPTPESQQAADFLLRFPIAEFAGPVARAATTQATTWSLKETTFVC